MSTQHAPPRRLWTREEFERAADQGLFGPEERLATFCPPPSDRKSEQLTA